MSEDWWGILKTLEDIERIIATELRLSTKADKYELAKALAHLSRARIYILSYLGDKG